ncbi:MAG TPA: hypothetical protein VG650_05060 [Mycobacteriales bacterium]|nr:hypothetical protein [Mycobacteriales bacterium]HWC34179.1 hypothetical protein [Mycobacteriales bacterium]
MTTIWVLLIGCWLAVAAERYFKRSRTMNAKEQTFIAESIDEAYAIKRQREALAQQAAASAVAPEGQVLAAGSSDIQHTTVAQGRS